MSVDLERELGTRLRQRSTAAPVGDGWEAIHRRIDARHRARRRRRVAGCGVAVVVALVASIAVVADSDREARVATRPPDSAVGRPALPRLVLDLPGWDVDHASTDEADAEPTVAPPLWLFTEPERGFDGKVVYVSVADPMAPYGMGEENPTAVQVDVRGRTGYLHVTPPSSGAVGQMGWRMADGTSVYLTSTRLTEEELVTFARNVEVGPDGEARPADALVAGWPGLPSRHGAGGVRRPCPRRGLLPSGPGRGGAATADRGGVAAR